MFANLPSLPKGYQPEVAITKLAGGLDLESPTWGVLEGAVRDALNYEAAIEGGYRDITGYERFDGLPAPSDASFTILDVTITGTIVVGNTVQGVTSGATGQVVAIATYPDDPSQSYLVLTKVTGLFDESSEDIQLGAGGAFEAFDDDAFDTGGFDSDAFAFFSGTTVGTTDAIGYADSAPTPKLAAQYKNLAADAYREDIAEVPGEGDVWGGFLLGSTKYAIRNKVGGVTAGLYMHHATTGWTEVALNEEVAFDSGGVNEILEGHTITGVISGETATVERIQVTSGTWAGADAAGWMILSGKSGAFQAENLNADAGANLATIAGDSAAATLEPDGRLDFDLSNFADPAGSERVYCADGVNTAWEFDGTVFAKIRTGMTTDTPTHVKVHKYQLFLSFVGSVQHSAPGDPWAWSVVLGAAEIATGFVITGFDIQPGAAVGGGALLIACRQRLFVLYGNDTSDWVLDRYREKIGAYEWTIQQIAYTLFLDDRGITDLQTSDKYGNFDHSSMSNMIRTLVNAKRLLAVASCVVRDKNQYRLFFSDKTAFYITMENEKLMGIMPVLLEHQVTCIWSQENAEGSEEIYFGCDDGFVYQMEKGTSFDGDAIFAYIYTHYDHGKSIEWLKGYEGPVTIEGTGTGYAEMDLGYELDYNRAETNQPLTQTAELPIATGSQFDTGLVWDTGITWDDSVTLPDLNLELRGEGKNIGWVITKNSDYFLPVNLTGIHYRFIRKHPTRG